MNNVQRFWCHDADNIMCVREFDYDTALIALGHSDAANQRLAERNKTALKQIAALRQHKTDYMEAAEETRKALQSRIDALQLLLNDRDEQLHSLEQSRRAEFDNGKAAEKRVEDLRDLLNKALLAIKRTYQAGRDRIVDMGGDCDSVEYMMNSDLTVQEIRTALSPVTQPAAVDEFSTCLDCFGSGTVSNGLTSSTVCNACNGTGRELPASAESR